MNSKGARVLSLLTRRVIVNFVTRSSHHGRKSNSRSFLKYNFIPLAFQHGNLLCFSDCPPKCWQCESPHKSELFCSKCKALQKLPQDLNYFDIIGVNKEYDIDVHNVQRKYRQLQTLLHPDRYGQKSDREKEISANLSSLVNKAYTTLLHPLDRGIYILKLENIFVDEKTTSLDLEFLMEIMELNEEVEEASKNEKILELLQMNRTTLESLNKQISAAFYSKNLERAKALLIKMKYYISVENKLKKLKHDLGIVE